MVNVNSHFKGAKKLYFMHYSGVVITLFNKNLCKSAFSTYSLKNPAFHLLVFIFFVCSILNLISSSQTYNICLLRRQYGKRANLKTGVSRKQSMPYFPKNEHFLPPDTHTLGGKKCSFFGKFGMLCFLETTVLRFALLPYY